MSSAELVPLFPSATHPAIPIAARILSTLRNLTAPGKGNDMKPEERAALVGISALLGCERIQSKDLPESSAQKASSVSPAHFRSALTRSRRLLAQVQLDAAGAGSGSGGSPSRRSPRKGTTEGQGLVGGAEAESGSGAGGSTAIDPLSPFQTPKKKFKYSSGIDVSDLLRSGSRGAHTPSQSSPLRHSTTPGGGGDAGKGEGSTAGRDVGVERTPTKRTKFHTKGVDLAAVDVDAEAEAEPGPSKIRRNDTAAFMALRPGSSPASRTVPQAGGFSDELPEEERAYLLSRRQRRTVKIARREGRSRLVRRNWTARESVWGSETVYERNRQVIDQVMARLPAYLADHGRPVAADLADPAVLLRSLEA